MISLKNLPTYVFQISWTIFVRTSGISSGTRLPQHLITNRDCELVADLFVLISSKISSKSLREILPDRRTSWSKRLSEFSNDWLGIDALIVAKFLERQIKKLICVRGYFLSFCDNLEKNGELVDDNGSTPKISSRNWCLDWDVEGSCATLLYFLSNNKSDAILRSKKSWKLTSPNKYMMVMAAGVSPHTPERWRGSYRQKGIWRIYHFEEMPLILFLFRKARKSQNFFLLFSLSLAVTLSLWTRMVFTRFEK